jgi:putative iron-regulated protein
MTINIKNLLPLSALLALSSCQPTTPEEVIGQYAANTHAVYRASLTTAEELQAKVNAFLAAPSVATLTSAREAWLSAREPYGQSEAARFYEGPIDSEDGPEGRINAWPLDEAFVDYVVENEEAGLVNDAAGFSTINKTLIAEQNEKDGEDKISTGYHAIEFLLWGQDLSATGPGNRPHTDYVLSATGPGKHAVRRATYLKEVTALLVDDLRFVAGEWDPSSKDNYAAELKAAAPNEALRRMFQGIGFLAGFELSGERISTALTNKDQEDEHSCFSDNTHRDLYGNALAVQNVWLGRYNGSDGPGLDDLVRAKDGKLADDISSQLDLVMKHIAAVPKPFDQAILGEDTKPARANLWTVVNTLKAAAENLQKAATQLGLTITIDDRS